MISLGVITGIAPGWWVAAGALALAPIAAHLLARGRARRIEFPGQRLLEEVVVTGRRASRPRDLAALALRALALAAAALAFSGVAWQSAGDAGAGVAGRVVVVLDASASMTRVDAGRSVFERARERAIAALEAPGVREGGVVVARRTASALLPEMTTKLAALRERTGGVGATLEAADLAGAIALARSLAGDAQLARIVVCTDGQGAASAGDLGRAVEVIDCSLRPWRGNRAITGLEIVERAGRDELLATLRAWGDGAGPARVLFEREGEIVGAAEATLTDGGETSASVPAPPGLNDAWSVYSARFESSDAAPWDDVRRAAAPGRASPSVAIITRSPGGAARWLRAAVNPFGTPEEEPAHTTPDAPGEAQVHIIAGAGSWSAPALDELARRLRSGAGALWVIDSKAAHESLAAFLARHAPGSGLRLGQAMAPSGGALRVQAAPWIDLAGAAGVLEEALVEERSSVIEADDARVALRFEDGAPALVRTALGRGALVTLHAPIDSAGSTLARSPALPILVDALLRALAPAPAQAANAAIGEPLVLHPASGRVARAGEALTDSLGRAVRVAGDDGSSLLVEPLDAPGVVMVTDESGALGAGAAHVEASESAPADEAPAKTAAQPRATDAPAQRAGERRTDLAPWLLLLAAGALLAESIVTSSRVSSGVAS